MIYIYISLLFSFLSAQVLTNNSFNTSRSISMAGATVSNPGNVEAVFYNPANLSNLKGSSFLVGTNARELALSNSLVSSYNMGFNSFSNPALFLLNFTKY